MEQRLDGGANSDNHQLQVLPTKGVGEDIELIRDKLLRLTPIMETKDYNSMEESCEVQINSSLRTSRIISTDPIIVPRLLPQNVFLEELKEKSKQKQLVRMLERRMSHDDDVSSSLKKSSCKNVSSDPKLAPLDLTQNVFLDELKMKIKQKQIVREEARQMIDNLPDTCSSPPSPPLPSLAWDSTYESIQTRDSVLKLVMSPVTEPKCNSPTQSCNTSSPVSVLSLDWDYEERKPHPELTPISVVSQPRTVI